MSVTKPRSKDTRWVEIDEMLIGEFEHERLRCAAYEKGHILSRDGKTAICGNPLLVTDHLHWWESFRTFLYSRYGHEAGEWWVAVDTRKGGLCTRCKNLSKGGITDPFERSAAADSYDSKDGEEWEELASPEPASTLVSGSAAERLMRVRSDSVVSRIARELNAEVITA